jgi:tetratricopeptide (TPR) repeat protein
MPTFESLLVVALLVLLAAGALGLWATLRRPTNSKALRALGEGRFAEALAAARTDARASRDDLYVAAVAAKHLLELDRARTLLDRILARDPTDGEAWLERGLTATYAGDFDGAETALQKAAALRSDLLESVTLHRAWVALRRGDRPAARRLFSEVEAPLENKLRSDLGSGEPLFAEWFLQAAALWSDAGDEERAAWALEEGKASAPESRLAAMTAMDPDAGAQPPLQ